MKTLGVVVILAALSAITGIAFNCSVVNSAQVTTLQPEAPAKLEVLVGAAMSSALTETPPVAAPPTHRLFAEGIRGITIGPIESALHADKGYGSAAFEHTLDRVRALGGNWVSLTVFGRVGDLHSTGIDWRFETPFKTNERALRRAVTLAHARGLKVMLVPHLWVESGGWRGEMEPLDEAAWQAWQKAYSAYVTRWAQSAAAVHVDLFAVGVELRSWLTTPRARSFIPVIEAVRRVYHGPITYAGNWDDVEETPILDHIDVIGVNAFYPLHDKDGASFDELRAGGLRVAERVKNLANAWNKPVIFTEMGYTNRQNPAVRPWEWPDSMKDVHLDPEAQAEAYLALLAGVLDEPAFNGFFVWRIYADPFDSSQEAEWGFSPLYRTAELIVRDAFKTRWLSSGAWSPAIHRREERPGAF